MPPEEMVQEEGLGKIQAISEKVAKMTTNNYQLDRIIGMLANMRWESEEIRSRLHKVDSTIARDFDDRLMEVQDILADISIDLHEHRLSEIDITMEVMKELL